MLLGILSEEDQCSKGISELLISPEEAKFTVRHPKVKDGTIFYQVRGHDSTGDWEGDRRYKEFDTLRNTLVMRFPGLPIPFLPEK